jgi:hypothetical protein
LCSSYLWGTPGWRDASSLPPPSPSSPGRTSRDSTHSLTRKRNSRWTPTLKSDHSSPSIDITIPTYRIDIKPSTQNALPRTPLWRSLIIIPPISGSTSPGSWVDHFGASHHCTEPHLLGRMVAVATVFKYNALECLRFRSSVAVGLGPLLQSAAITPSISRAVAGSHGYPPFT